ncbi:MAG: polysaccharide pyruvyl transferase family protein [Eubacterium sp.]|nr:polysaccharide pyruvyl transferase family protein [Eubacterium sp.]
MKIGILTHYNVYNQGAQLQMYAMKNWLEELGHQVYILTYQKNFDFDHKKEKRNSGSVANIGYYIKEYLLKEGLGVTLFNTKKVTKLKKDFEKVETRPYDASDCDAIIIGSDEVFSIDVGCNRMMYGYGIENIPAIAYAPAFGRTTEETLKQFNCYDLVKEGLSNLYQLSARDVHTRKMIQSLTGRDVPLVCDPVILYSGKAFHVPVKKIKKKYMIIYAYGRHMVDKDEVREIKAYAKKHQLLTVSLGTYHKWCDKNIVCDAQEWYSYFQDAECVLTDTFHGSVVAMKNHCNLAVYIRESINSFKMTSLLESTGLQKNRLESITENNLEKVLSQKIDYALVDENISKMVKESETYLLNSLESINEK